MTAWLPKLAVQLYIKEQCALRIIRVISIYLFFAHLLTLIYERAGPGVLAGLQEADRRGLVSSVYFNISFRDSHCDNIYAPKVNIEQSGTNQEFAK